MSNQIVWVDIPVVDLDRAIRFYSAVLGQPVERQEFAGKCLALLPHAHDAVSGCLSSMGECKPSREGPLIYLNAEGRLDEAIAAVPANGGRVLEAKHPIGQYGFRALVVDSEGNRVALHSP